MLNLGKCRVRPRKILIEGRVLNLFELAKLVHKSHEQTQMFISKRREVSCLLQRFKTLGPNECFDFFVNKGSVQVVKRLYYFKCIHREHALDLLDSFAYFYVEVKGKDCYCQAVLY